MAAYHPVFIDTSLDTHLVIVISNLDTTSDLKRKTEEEHPLCFPATGKIAVQAVKVKCNGRHYYLPDSFLVNFAFRGVLENWVLSLDVSTLDEHDGNQCPRNLLTFGGIPNNNYVDIVEHSLNGSIRQGIHSGKRTEVSEELAIIKHDMSKHDSVLQCNMLEGENIMENSASNVATSKMEITTDSLQDNEKIENLPSDGLCLKLVNDVHNSENRRKKKKRRKQHNVEVAASPTSGKEVREEDVALTILNNNNSLKPSIESDLRCCDQGQRLSEVHRSNVEAKHCDSIQEVGRPNTKPSAIDADITKSDAVNVQGSYTGNAKDQYVFGVEANPLLNAKVPNNLQMITELSGLKNISTVQIQQVEEERAFLQKNDSEKMQPKKFKPPSKGEIEVNNLMVTLDLLDQDGTVEPKNSSKKRKKTKNSVRKTLFSSDRDNAKCSEPENSSVEPQETLCREYPSDKTKTAESKFSARNCELMKTNTEHTVVQKDAIVGHEFVFLQNISVTGANTENRDESVRKKSEKKQTPLAQISTYLKAEDKSLHQNSMVEANGKREVLFASSLSQRKFLEEPALSEQENGPGLECGVRTSVPTELDLELGKPTMVQSDTLGNTYERMPARVDLNGNTPSTSCQYVANNSTGSSTKGSKINSQKHIPNLCQHEDDASVELIANKNYKNKADNEVDSSQKIKLTQTNAENTEEIVRRKSKKQKSLAENCTNVEAEDQNVVHQNKILETNDNRVVTLSCQSKSKTLKKPVSKDHLNGIGLESENLRVESYPVPGHSNKECGKLTNLQLEAVGNSLGNINCNAHTPIVGSEDKAHNPADSSGESSSINFKKYFLKQQYHEVDAPGEVLIDRSNRNRTDNDPKVIKKKKKNDSLTSGNSPALLVSLKSNDKQGIGGKLQLESSSPISPQGSFVRGDSADFEIPCEKFPKTSRQETRPLLSGMSSKLDSNPEVENNNVGNDSGVNTHSEQKGETFTLVNSNLEKSRSTACQNSTSYKHPSQLYHKGNVVPSGKNNRKVANSSEGRNNSSAVPTSILSGYVSESSEDGTKTPSDHSAFSHSDGESNSICTSPVDGSSTLEIKRTGGRSKKSSFSSRAKYLTLDTILRSSIRYKRARFTASQLHQEDDSKKLVL